MTSIGEASPMRIWGTEQGSNKENYSLVESMWCEAPKSRIHYLQELVVAMSIIAFPFPNFEEVENAWE